MTWSSDIPRLTIAAAAVAFPIGHALLWRTDGWPLWPTVVALMAGAVLRQQAGAGWIAAVLLALAPVWQAATGRDATLFQTVMPWLAFGAAGLAWPTGAGPSGGRAWHATAAAWGLVVVCVAPVVAARELDFSRYAIGAATANGASGAAPHQAAAMVLLMAEAQLLALLVFDWALGASATDRRRTWRWLLPGLAVAAAITIWQQTVDPTWLSREPWTVLRRAPGTLFDANAMGAFFALTAAIAASAHVRPSRMPAVMWGVGIWTLSLGAIVSTGSRSALAAALVALGVTLVRWGRPLPRLALITLVVGVGWLLWPAQIGDPAIGDAIGRLVASVNELRSDLGSTLKAALWTRGGYGPAARTLVAEHPWVGGGVGAFGTLVGDYAALNGVRGLRPDNAQNWWLHQIAELGVAGALPLVIASLLAGVACVRAARRPNGAAAAGALLALGVLSLLSPPTQHPVVQIVVALVVAHGVAETTGAPGVGRMRGVGVALFVLALGCAVATAVEGVRSLRPSLRAARFQAEYHYGFDAFGVTPFGSGLWTTPQAVGVVAPGGGAIHVEVSVPHDDLATTPVTVRVLDRDGLVCTFDAHDHGPFVCRVPVRPPDWPLVRLDVSRPFLRDDGAVRGAVVTARFEP